MTSVAPCLAPGEAPQLVLAPKVARCIDPLADPRWDKFLQKHPRASMFHSTAWLEALRRTYGFRTVAYTTSADGEDLENAIVFCQIESWITGRRLVSLPFSDHCDPLVDTNVDTKEDSNGESNEDRDLLAAALEREFELERWSYFELRPLQSLALDTALRHTEVTYAFHVLDLAPPIDVIYANFHKSSTERKIRRAARENLVYREGSTRN